MNIDYRTESPLKLLLDYENPRFLKELHSEDEVRSYLIEYEDSLSVAHSLKKFGILPGELVICLSEGDKLMVIEGNRRVSVMQMLLDRSLIPEKHINDVPEVPAEVLKEIESIPIQVIDDRDDALTVMANRHLLRIKEWKPLAKKKFFTSRFDEGMSIDELSRVTNIRAGEIRDDIADYKFFMRNYDEYKRNNPSFSIDLADISIDRFLRVFTTRTSSDEGTVNGKAYLMMSRDEELEYSSELPNDVFTKFSQHVFSKAFDSTKDDSVNTRSNFDDIPDISEWKTKIDKSRLEIVRRSEKEEDYEDPKKIEPPKEVTAPPEPDKRKRTGGPAPPRFMEGLLWADRLDPINRDHIPLLRLVYELKDISKGNRGSGYTKYPIAAALLTRSAYEQGLILLLKTSGLWDKYESKNKDPRRQTLKSLEAFVESNRGKCMKKHTLLWNSFTNILNGNYREFLNQCTHDLDYTFPSKDKLEAMAGEGLCGFLQSVVDKAGKVSEMDG